MTTIDLPLTLARLGWLLRWRALGLLLAAGLTACSPAAPRAQFKSVDITGIKYARDFALTDDHGVLRHLADFRGRVVVVFFGYTSCPDVCPLTMTHLAEVMQRLGARADQVQVLFVTVDPQRDTPAVLAKYLPNFNSHFLGLVGTPQQTAAVAKEFKVFYQKVDGPTADSYSIDHTAASFVFDAAGHPRLYVPDDLPPADVAHDLNLLLDAKNNQAAG